MDGIFTYKNWVAITAFLAVLLNFSCEDNATNVDQQNQKIKEIREAYNSVESFSDYDKIYETYKNEKDPDVKLFNEILLEYKANWDSRKLLPLIDSINNAAPSEKVPEYMQEFINYLAAKISLKFNRPKKAYEYNLKSIEITKKFPELFEEEKIRNQALKDKISSSFFNSVETKYQILKKSIETDRLTKAEKYFSFYNMAVYDYDLGNSKESMQYLKAFLHKNNSPKNYLFLDANALLALNYARLKQYDSIPPIEERIREFYDNNEITETEYLMFLANSLKANFTLMSQKQIESRIQQLTAYFSNTHKSNYLQSVILEAETMYYEYIKDTAKEKRALLRATHQIGQSKTLDEYRMNEQSRIYRRLIKIGIMENDLQNTRFWYSKLKDLEMTKNKIRQEYVSFLQYLSYRDLQLSKTNFAKLQEGVNTQKRINILYLGIMIIFVILVSYSANLYFKSQKYREKLNKKYKQISLENARIKDQHEKLKMAIDALEESNQDLKNFARVAAHDIKSPISTITSGISFLQEYYQPKIKSEHFHYFENLKASISVLVKMIADLLNEKHSH